MNDNYYPLKQLVLTEKEKQAFLKKDLPSLVDIDKGIKGLVEKINEKPYFLTQSSCEGQSEANPSPTHMPVPYVSIGVLYNQFDLLQELADYLWVQLKGKIHSLSLDAEVQAVNDTPLNHEVIPNYQEYLSVFLKTKRGISLLSDAVDAFTPEQEIVTSSGNVELNIVERMNKLLFLLNRLAHHEQVLQRGIKDLAQQLKDVPALSNVNLRDMPNDKHGYGNHFILEFYVKDDDYSIRDLFQLLTSVYSGGILTNIVFQKTSSGGYVKKVALSLMDTDRVDLFTMIVQHWSKVGCWEKSPYWN